MCALLALALSSPSYAQRQTERSRQKATAEKQRAGVKQRLEAIRKDAKIEYQPGFAPPKGGANSTAPAGAAAGTPAAGAEKAS